MIAKTVDYIIYTLLGLSQTSKTAEALNFFIYDSVKILLLLFVMISVIGVFRTYVSNEKIKKWTAGGSKLKGAFLASLFGVLTPFCSCSSIPIFLGFIKAGVNLSSAFSFLITSPLVNEYLVVLMLGFFGVKITLIYIISGMVIGICGGVILGSLKLERFIEADFKTPTDDCSHKGKYPNFKSRMVFGLGEGKDIFLKIYKWVLLGVALGAVIHNFVPDEAVARITTSAGIFTVPLAAFIGVPMYGSCAAIVPVAVVLFKKGAALGTALAFMMAVSALSFPEAVILRRAMKLKLILIFFGSVFTGIVIIGYLINFAY